MYQMFKEAIRKALMKLSVSSSDNKEAIAELSEALINQFELNRVRLSSVENKLVALEREIKNQTDITSARAHSLSNFVMGLELKVDELAEYITLLTDPYSVTDDPPNVEE